MNNSSPNTPHDEETSNAAHQALPSTRINAGAIAQVGALVSAIVASACCWLPLLLIAFGVSGGALSATFEQWRPVFLPVTFVFLGVAFYFTYRKPKVGVLSDAGTDEESCCTVPVADMDEQGCCPPEGSTGFTIKKFNKVILWVVTVIVVAFAFFPNYIGSLMGGDGNALAAREDLDKVVVSIDGMTCEACAVTIKKSLLAVPGVADAEVSYEKGEALIGTFKDTQLPRSEIISAIAGAGYSGQFTDQLHWVLDIEGMTCQGCESLVETALLKVPGVQGISVTHENGRATVTTNDTSTEETLSKAIQDAGFTLKSAKKNNDQ